MNVRKASMRKIGANTEISHLVKILGLEFGKKYQTKEDLASLRYKKVNVFSDQDLDGHHIAGLIINFIHAQWPSLFELKPNFIERFATPIMKVRHKRNSAKEMDFFTLHEYNEWAKENEKSLHLWNIKYLKGLGSSNNQDAKRYFKALRKHTVDFTLQDRTDNKAIELAFDPDRADERKEWLLKYDPSTYVDYSVDSITTKMFFDNEFIHFSNYDNIRSIPCAVDGLKPTQRKVLFGCLKSRQFNEVKVSQLVGRIAEMTNYHHGEASLVETICAMAQDHLGTNNVNYLYPEGQFGSRLAKPSIHAQPRYIYTYIDKITRFLFRQEDDPILEYIQDEGQSTEPVTYYPILPTVLFNGATGIGTGWSTDVPCYHPLEVANAIRKLVDGDTTTDFQLLPFYIGFGGKITRSEDDDAIIVSGIYQTGPGRVEIFELPVGRWTDDYITEISRKFLVQSSNGDQRNQNLLFIRDIDNLSTESKVHIVLHCDHDKLARIEKRDGGVGKLLRLHSTIRTSNMYLFEPGASLRKFNDTNTILRYFYKRRLEMYHKRKDYQIKALRDKIRRLSNEIKFIKYVMEGKLKLFNRKIADLEKDMEDLDLERLGDPPSFEYLTNMPFISATSEKMERLMKNMKETQDALDKLLGTDVKDLWRRDIDEFEEAYLQFLKIRSEKYGYPMESDGGRPPHIIPQPIGHEPRGRKRSSQRTSARTKKGTKRTTLQKGVSRRGISSRSSRASTRSKASRSSVSYSRSTSSRRKLL